MLLHGKVHLFEPVHNVLWNSPNKMDGGGVSS